MEKPKAETMKAMEEAAKRDWPILSNRPLSVPGLPTATFIALKTSTSE